VTAKVDWKATAPLNVRVDPETAPSAVEVVTANVDWNATAPEAVIVVQESAPVVNPLKVVAALLPPISIPFAAPGAAAAPTS